MNLFIQYRSVVFVRKDIWRENEASEYVLAAKADQRVLLDSEATTSRVSIFQSYRTHVLVYLNHPTHLGRELQCQFHQ